MLTCIEQNPDQSREDSFIGLICTPHVAAPTIPTWVWWISSLIWLQYCAVCVTKFAEWSPSMYWVVCWPTTRVPVYVHTVQDALFIYGKRARNRQTGSFETAEDPLVEALISNPYCDGGRADTRRSCSRKPRRFNMSRDTIRLVILIAMTTTL